MAIAMSLSCLLTACGGGEDECSSHTDTNGDYVCDFCTENIPDTRIDYKVTVKDGSGELVSGVFVMVYAESDTQMQERVTMKMTQADGAASFKLEAGTYIIKVVNTKDVQLEYDTEKITLTEARPNLEVTVYDKLSETTDTMYGEKYVLTPGSYRVNFSDEEITYFVFVPDRTGIYQIGIIADTQVELGGYGNPWNILDFDTAEHIDISTVKITVNPENLGGGSSETTKYTVGIKGRLKSGAGTLVVKKVGDVQLIPENTAPIPNLSEFSYRGGVPEDVNITASSLKRYNAVYNTSDGYYHLCMQHTTDASHVCEPDGPIIYVRLASDDGYLNFGAMLEAGNGMKCIIYNAEGTPLERKDYTAMLAAYIEAADDTYGIHPLTEQLREAIQNCGEYMGWFDKENPNYLFEGATILSRYKGMEYLMFCCFGG